MFSDGGSKGGRSDGGSEKSVLSIPRDTNNGYAGWIQLLLVNPEHLYT